MIRALVLVLVLLGAALWAAPAVFAPHVANGLAAQAGLSLEFDVFRPALPWGVTAERVTVLRGERRIELSELSARASDGGLRVEARAGAGSLLLKTRGLRALRSLRAQALPLEALSAFLPGELALRGTADGVYRAGDGHGALEATVRQGALSLRDPVELEIPFAQLVITAAREADGGWRVDFADLRGPPLSGQAHGRIDASGRLALRVEISELEEPALSAFMLAGLPTGPLPIEAELGGTLEQPALTAIGTAAR